jgi:hypothetical protein
VICVERGSFSFVIGICMVLEFRKLQLTFLKTRNYICLMPSHLLIYVSARNVIYINGSLLI